MRNISKERKMKRISNQYHSAVSYANPSMLGYLDAFAGVIYCNTEDVSRTMQAVAFSIGKF